VDLHKIWHVASLYGHGEGCFEGRMIPRAHAQHAVCTPLKSAADHAHHAEEMSMGV